MKKDILKEEVDQIISQSFWGIGGVKLTENTETAPAAVQAEEKVEAEEVNEETHSCPLCESTLESPISDEKLTEHIEMMLGIINEMNDITDEELEAIEEEIDEVADDEEDAEVVEEAKKKMPAFLKDKMDKKGMQGKKSPMAKA